MEKELKILTATVTIQLVTVDGKRMTKAVFNQIKNEICFDSQLNLIADSILGYVNINGDMYLLWIKRGELRKTFLNPLIDFKNRGWVSDRIGYSIEWENSSLFKVLKSPLTSDSLLKEMLDKARNFLLKIEGSQLYIAI